MYISTQLEHWTQNIPKEVKDKDEKKTGTFKAQIVWEQFTYMAFSIAPISLDIPKP